MLSKTSYSSGKDQFINNTFNSNEWSAPIMVSPEEIKERMRSIDQLKR